MRKYKVYQVDSFTDKKFTGNPAGVVYQAEGLTEEDMKRIARELNNSETAFIFEDKSGEANYHVRFFTPTKEVPICGHATIAAHYVIALEKNIKENTVITQRTGAGILDVEIIPSENNYLIKMTQGTIEFENILIGENREDLLLALGIGKDEVLETLPIQIVSTGHSKVMIPLKNYSTLDNLHPDMKALEILSQKIGCNGYFTFVFNEEGEETLTTGRMFAPAIGIVEDPVTGNANGPLGAYLVNYNILDSKKDFVNFIGKQGVTINREGKVFVEVFNKEGKPKKVKVAGKAVTIFKTEIEV